MKETLTVFGAGVFGLSCAYVAARRGWHVRVIDPHGVGAGSSGGIVGALAPHTPENWNEKKAFQFESLILSRGFWPEVEARAGVLSGYGATGRVQAIETDRQLGLARAREAQAHQFWGDEATWRVIDETPDFAPQSPTGHWVLDTLSARINPWRACEALAAAVTAQGGEILRDGDAIGPVIHASGWEGLKDLNRAFDQEVGNGVKGQAILLEYSKPDAPQVYAEGLHVITHADGTTAIGSTSEREFAAPDACDTQADDLLVRALDALPELQGARELKRWAGVRPRAKSRAPMLGAWPDREGHFIANGGFKIGFGMAPLCANRLIDLISEGVDNIPESFAPSASIRGGARS